MPRVLIAIDLGNSQAKWGLFRGDQLIETAKYNAGTEYDDGTFKTQCTRWNVDPSVSWVVSYSTPAPSLLSEIDSLSPQQVQVVRTSRQIDLETDLSNPETVGVDRLFNAAAANRMRSPDQSAIIVDCGTAITVDAVSADGVFLGGAILPGLHTSARSLNHYTSALPLIDPEPVPAAPGKNTEDAIRAGVFWGTVGAIEKLASAFGNQLGLPQLYCTGGDGDVIQRHCGLTMHYQPHLTLLGMAANFWHTCGEQKGSAPS